jgi:2'-5' RNA ligase
MPALFIALPIPPAATAYIRKTLTSQSLPVRSLVPAQRWHITLAFLGEVILADTQYAGLLQDLPQTFAPTITLTHLGRGAARGQLWMYVRPGPALLQVKQSLAMRLQALGIPVHEHPVFVPHIHVADVVENADVTDQAVQLTFAAPSLTLFRSAEAGGKIDYIPEGTIALH